jgi:quercetin dioxygenase-like cupin family protein
MFTPALTLLAVLLPAASALAQSGEGVVVQRAGSQAPSIGAAQNFTGMVRVEGRFQGSPPARISGGTVIFEPGARTAWHTHPLGQTLIVTAGIGLVQHWGGAIQEIRPGDIVWIPPGVKHWHGAAAATGMTHVAISEALNGKTVDWMELVSAEQYRR